MKMMFRRIRLLTLALLVASVSAVSTFAADTFAVSSSKFQTHQGETFTTTIFIPDNANIVDFDITLKYDTDKLTLVQIEENEDIKGTVIYNDQVPGELPINYTRTSRNVTSYMPLLDVTFSVDDNVGVGSYDCFTVDRTKAYIAHRLNSAGNAVEVGFDCEFAKLTIYEMGDVDLSGSVDIADATRIRRHLAEFSGAVFQNFNLSLADTHYDGIVDVADAVTLQRHLARLGGTYGNRVNLTFYDRSGRQYATKSVQFGGSLHNVPSVPSVEGFSDGMWSLSANSLVAPTYSNLQTDVSLYAYYSNQANPAMDYYKKQLTTMLYSGDMPSNLSSNLGLSSTMNYQNGWHATLLYSSDCNYVLNSTTGAFTKPTYPQKINLTVSITSYDNNNRIDSEGSITFAYDVPGEYQAPTKADVEDFLKFYFTDDTDGKYRVNYDVKLISKLNNTVIPVDGAQYDNFEIRLSWYQNNNGRLIPVSQVKRTTVMQNNDYVAVATFNGRPLEDDGRIYIDNVEVTAIDQMEIKNYIINQIAANMGTLATEGTLLWNNDSMYGTNITWETGAPDIGYVANNIVRLKNNAVSGSTLPLNARVSYAVDGGSEEFVLNYNLTVSCDNTIIKAPENMDPDLYRAIKTELEDTMGYRGDLTSAALADVRFVNLDLSDYPDISSLRGLSYCKNLRTLNISGLHVTDGTMNQIATLSYLEAFIARGCGLTSLTDGGTATLRNAVNLKMIDLTDNLFTSLDSVFAEGVKYGSIREVYLSKNRLTDVNALSRAPMMTYLSLSENGLTTQGTACIENYPYLTYLSLANNQIDSVVHLKGLKYLKELRLQNNDLANVNDLRRLVNLEILYLGHNNIQDIGFLNTLTKLQILYANDNRIADISALRDLAELQCINVSNNNLTSLSVLNNYKSTLTEIYAENNRLTDFSFISGASNLRVLMLSGNQTVLTQDNMIIWLSGLTELEILTLSDIRLQNLSFLSGATKLVRLDVANCGLSAFSGDTSNIQMIADHYATLKVLDISNNDFSGGEDELLRLRNATLLTVLYADNVCSNLDAYTLTYSMTELKFISLENCGVSTVSWLSRFNDLVYVDVAGCCLSELDLDQSISNASCKTIKELYLDTTTPCSFANAYRITDFNVERLSLSGVTIGRIEALPYLDEIRYLNLDGTGLTNLTGEDVELADIYSIERYGTLETIDVSNLETDISPLEQIRSLQTVYAVGATDSMMFHECNLHSLQRMYKQGVTCYLYNKDDAFAPVAKTEGTEILALLPDYSCDITVAADYVISDNNPVLAEEINDFTIDWEVNNHNNYAIVQNRISAKDYTDIDDETLVLTATITVYPDQQKVSRDFRVNTHILRVSDFAEVSSTSALNLSASNEPSVLSLMGDTSIGTSSGSLEVTDKEELENALADVTVTDNSEYLTSDDGAFSNEIVTEDNGFEEAIEASTDVGTTDRSEGNVFDEANIEGVSAGSDDVAEVEKENALSEEDSTCDVDGVEAKDNDCAEDDIRIAEKEIFETIEQGEDGLSCEETGNKHDQSDDDTNNLLKLLSAEESTADDTEEEIVEYPLWLLGQTVSQYSGTIPCVTYEIENFFDYMTRGKEFRYCIGIQAADYPDFSRPVKPVVDEIRYVYNTTLSDGTSAPYTSVLNDDGNGNYSILNNAPLGSVTTITTSIGHKIGESFIPDEIMQRSFEITSRSYTITYVTNGGTVTLNKDGSVITTQELPEDSVLFQNITVTRTGYLFDGWFTDSNLQQLFSNGTNEVQMPAHDLTLYAKWTAHSYTISFDANGGTVNAKPILALCGTPIGTLPTPTRSLYTFDGWYTAKNGGEKITASSVRETATDLPLYAHWKANQHTVTFNANYSGGTVSKPSMTVTCDSKIGTLPSMSRDYYDFDGWYDAAAGGNKYTADTVIKSDCDFTLYAHWTIHPLSDWALASNVPAGAKIENNKWKYKERTNTESKSTSLSGWTQYDSYWVKSGDGSFNYASFPYGFDTGNWYYQNWNRSALSEYTYETTKRDVSTWWAGYIYWHWMYDSGTGNGTEYRAINNASEWGHDNGYWYGRFGAFTSTRGDYYSDIYYCNSKCITNYVIPERYAFNDCQGATRWFRFDYYGCSYTDYYKMFKYYKVESKESTSQVYATDLISDVQHWVRYRVK